MNKEQIAEQIAKKHGLPFPNQSSYRYNVIAAIIEAMSLTDPKWVKVEDGMPKPEQRVLIHFKNGNKTYTTIAFHVPKNHKEDEADYDGDSEYNEEEDKYYWPEGWYEWQYDSEVNFHLSYNVTHWMPLPAPPYESPTNKEACSQ